MWEKKKLTEKTCKYKYNYILTIYSIVVDLVVKFLEKKKRHINKDKHENKIIKSQGLHSKVYITSNL